MRDLSSSRLEPRVRRVGGGFVTTYALAYMSIALMLIAPLLVTLALKIKSLVGIDQAPRPASLSSPASAACCPCSATRSSAG